MNIKEAKQEIIHTVQAYLDKDETGAYTIPPERQRPILLMGPPGIGKTAIMEQVAQECGIGLVSYTITHHTRQSAIGLPFISKKSYGGREYSVTEYTMSEIIAAVYDQIEASGVKEGILFLDEINCVSETLAPTMLQFLQYKTFGTHRVPDGFLIVTAGNPPQYNKSVRDFDIVTLDRLRRIDIEEDYPAFKEYASRAGLHGSVMAYLAIRTPHFYSIRTEVEGRYFVTARGWEDLSRTIQVHEKNHLPVDERLAAQFLQDAEIARSFSAYYDLYRKYRDVYRVPAILAGRFYTDKDEYNRAVSGADAREMLTGAGDRDPSKMLSAAEALCPDPAGTAVDESALYLDPVRIQEMQEAPFDEKLSLISLLIDALGQSFSACALEREVQELLLRELGLVRQELKEAPAEAKTAAAAAVRSRCDAILSALRKKKDAGIPVPRRLEHVQRLACRAMEELEKQLREPATAGSAGGNAAEPLPRTGAVQPSEYPGEPVWGAAGEPADEPAAAGSGGRRNTPKEQYAFIRRWFSAREQGRQESGRRADDSLTNVFRFLSTVYGDGQEMVLFLTELSAGYYSMKFINEHGNDAFFRYNRMLLLRDRRDALREEVLRLMQ